jgi:hypothetical protein
MSEAVDTEQPSAPAQRVMNPDGSTNWAVLFDDPEQGILEAVRAAKSLKQLRPVMASVALLLFKRKRDAEPRAEFTAQMDRIMDSVEIAGFEAAQARIVAILDAEKSLRIEKAAQHARNKLSQSIERRRESTDDGLFGKIIGNPFLLAGSVAGLLSVIALVLGMFILPTGDAPVEQRAQTEETERAKAAPKPASPTAPSAAPRPKPPMSEAVALKPILNEVNVDGTRRRLSLVPMISVETGGKISGICSLAPWIREGVLLRMGAATEAGRNADSALISDVAAAVGADINARSSEVKIKRLSLVDIRDLPKGSAVAANRGCERVKFDPKS